jgi:hypothetical protein
MNLFLFRGALGAPGVPLGGEIAVVMPPTGCILIRASPETEAEVEAAVRADLAGANSEEMEWALEQGFVGVGVGVDWGGLLLGAGLLLGDLAGVVFGFESESEGAETAGVGADLETTGADLETAGAGADFEGTSMVTGALLGPLAMLDRGTPDPLDVAFIVVVVVSRTVVVLIFGLLAVLVVPAVWLGPVIGGVIMFVVVTRTVVVEGPIFGLLVEAILVGPGDGPRLVMGVVIVVVVVSRTVVVPIFGEWLSSSWAMQRARFWRMSKALSLRKYMVSCVRDVRA